MPGSHCYQQPGIFHSPYCRGASCWSCRLVYVFNIQCYNYRLFYFYLFTAETLPRKDLLEIFDISFGRYIGFLFSFIYASSFLAASGILLREFYELLKSYVFPNTPISVINGTIIIILIVAAFLGLETIARTAKLAAFFALFGYLALLILSSQYFKLSNLFPVFGYGIGKTILEGFTRSSAYSEVIVLAVFAGSLQGVKNIKKAGYLSLVLSGLLVY